MSTIDMKGIKALQADASHRYFDAIAARTHVLQVHAGYSAALQTASKARDAYVALQKKAGDIIAQLAAEDAAVQKAAPNAYVAQTDPSWYDYLGQVQAEAWARDAELGNMMQQVLADMAAHLYKLSPADQAKVASAATPEGKASVVDSAASKGGGLGYVPGTRPNPNTQTPGAQSSSSPVASAPPVADGGTSGWLIAGAVLAGGLAMRLFGWL